MGAQPNCNALGGGSGFGVDRSKLEVGLTRLPTLELTSPGLARLSQSNKKEALIMATVIAIIRRINVRSILAVVVVVVVVVVIVVVVVVVAVARIILETGIILRIPIIILLIQETLHDLSRL